LKGGEGGKASTREGQKRKRTAFERENRTAMGRKKKKPLNHVAEGSIRGRHAKKTKRSTLKPKRVQRKAAVPNSRRWTREGGKNDDERERTPTIKCAIFRVQAERERESKVTPNASHLWRRGEPGESIFFKPEKSSTRHQNLLMGDKW